ncbi:MAG TPA: PilZ domain-containing protein [Polyangiaceae bacterium]|nr:PilZ domain-containing protein [Polyangiaceae bacterium]
MPTSGWAGSERRAHPRVPFHATARLFTEAQVIGDYTVQDLSVGGALLYGSVALTVGAVLGVWLSSTRLGAVRVAAEVKRVQRGADGKVAIGLKFKNPSSKIEAMIQEAVLAELEAASKLEPESGKP